MEKIMLSLKSVYMLLMTDDFPVYSESVIGKADRKGQTLLRFWQHQIAEEFRSLPYGKMIWRGGEKRNRYTSYLCNRSAELRCYQEYAKEIASQASTKALLGQIGRFMEFLSGKRYRQDILVRRVRELIRLAESEDIRVTGEIAQQIKDAAAPGLQEEGSRGELFQAGYLLTLLTLYAAAGEAMDDPSMAVLRGERYSREELWQSYLKNRNQPRGQSSSPAFLTVHSAMLQDNLLSRERFFGREEELYDLREMVEVQRKCLISGIGGIGKTEVLRQLLRRCLEEGAADRIAVVPYVINIMESFARAFPGFQRREPEEEFHRVLWQMGQNAGQGSRILLLIDNVDRSLEEDPALRLLCDLPCSIVMTTRLQSMEGFETYRIQPPAVSAGMLIFRDNYGRPLTGEDRAALAGMLADEALCCPATLRLMARAAGSKGWPVEELRNQLEKNGISLSWQEGDRTVRLGQMYRQLYSYMSIPRKSQALVELFTLLPRASYSAGFLRENFPEAAGKIHSDSAEEDSLERRLGILAAGGWLEGDGSGYSMHPLIAQCLRRKILTEKRLERVLGTIRARMLREDPVGRPEYVNEEMQRICHIFLGICRLLSGSISREMMLAALNASYCLFPGRQDVKEYRRLLTRLVEHCPEKDDQIEVFLYTVLGRFEVEDAVQFVPVYHRQKEHPTVPRRLFIEFCVGVGGTLFRNREFALAEQMVREGLCEDATPSQKAMAYAQLSALREAQGDWEGQGEWSLRGEEYVTAHPECGEYERILNLYNRCMFQMIGGNKEAAGVLKEKLQGLMREDSAGEVKFAYETVAGFYEMSFGSMEQALVHYKKCLERILWRWGKRDEYFTTLGNICIVLQRLQRYEEAVSAYGEIIEYTRKTDNKNLLQRCSNNLGAMYLDMGKPGVALPHLSVALEEGRKLGGICLAEALRNMARAYGLLGDTASEYGYYREAVPLLEEVYGPEHPRTAEAKARLAELAEDPEGSPCVHQVFTGCRQAQGSPGDR